MLQTPNHPERASTNPGTAADIRLLTCWKEIAQYMGKGVRTVQRWEQDFGLPVRRPQGSDKRAVFARPCDLDAWIAIRCSTSAGCMLPDHQNVKSASLSVRSSLAAELETSRMLRDANRALRVEMRSALKQLKERLIHLQQMSA